MQKESKFLSFALMTTMACLMAAPAIGQVTISIDVSSACGDTTINGSVNADVGSTITVGIALTATEAVGGYSLNFPSWPGLLEYVDGSAATCEGFSAQGPPTLIDHSDVPAGQEAYRYTAIRASNLPVTTATVVMTVQYSVLAEGAANFDAASIVNDGGATRRPHVVLSTGVNRGPHTVVAGVVTGVEAGVDTPVPTDTPDVAEPTDTPVVVDPTETPVPPTDTPVEVDPTSTPTHDPEVTPTDTPCDNCANDVGILVLESFGGIHAAGTARDDRSYRSNAPYWTLPGIAISLTVNQDDPEQALVTDLYGGVHYVNWGNARQIVDDTSFYWFFGGVGAQTLFAVDAELSGPNGNGAYVLANTGLIGHSGLEANTAPLPNAPPLGNGGHYVDFELYAPAGVATGYWAMDNNGNIVAVGAAPALTTEELANLGAGTAGNFVDFEVLAFGTDVVVVAMRADGTFSTSTGSMVLPDGTDLTELPVLAMGDTAVDFEYQTADQGGTSLLDPAGDRAGIVRLTAFGFVDATSGAEYPQRLPFFGAPFATGVEVADFSSPMPQ